MKAAALSALVADAMVRSKFDQLLTKGQFNESQRHILIAAEVHDLFEREEIDLVMEDNETTDCQIEKVQGVRVLLMHPSCKYEAWRKLYDKITND